MNVESLIKGKVAESAVELLLEQSGYKVVRIANDGLPLGLHRSDIGCLNQSNSAGKITTAPSLAVFDKKKGSVVLVKVKFKGAKSKGGNITHGITQLIKYWPEAILIVVTTEDPYFQLVRCPGESEDIESIFPQIKKETLSGFGGTVKKILK